VSTVDLVTCSSKQINTHPSPLHRTQQAPPPALLNPPMTKNHALHYTIVRTQLLRYRNDNRKFYVSLLWNTQMYRSVYTIISHRVQQPAMKHLMFPKQGHCLQKFNTPSKKVYVLQGKLDISTMIMYLTLPLTSTTSTNPLRKPKKSHVKLNNCILNNFNYHYMSQYYSFIGSNSLFFYNFYCERKASTSLYFSTHVIMILLMMADNSRKML